MPRQVRPVARQTAQAEDWPGPDSVRLRVPCIAAVLRVETYILPLLLFFSFNAIRVGAQQELFRRLWNMLEQPVCHLALFFQNGFKGWNGGGIARLFGRSQQRGVAGNFKLLKNVAADRAFNNFVG